MSLESSSPQSNNNYQYSSDLAISPSESIDINQSNVNSNLPVITQTKMYKCKQCVFVCMNKEDYWQHQRQMHIKPDKLLACTKCSFVTEYKHHLEYHFRNHMGSKPYKCTQCEYACINLSMLRSHHKSHSKALQYTCADCTYSTKYYHSLKTHLEKFGHSASGSQSSSASNTSNINNSNNNNRSISKKSKEIHTKSPNSSIPSSNSSSLSSSPSFTSPASSNNFQTSNNTSNLLNPMSLTAALAPYQNSNPLLPLFAAAAAAAQQSNNDLNLIQQQMQLQIALAAAAASGNSTSPFLVQSLADFFLQQEQKFQQNNSSFLSNQIESNEKCENIDPNDRTRIQHSPSSNTSSILSSSSSTLLPQQNKTIKCKLCNSMFDNKKELKKHLKSNHETGKQQIKNEKLFECRKCELFFRNQEMLNAHNMMHDLKDSQQSVNQQQQIQQQMFYSGNNLINQQLNTSEQLKCLQCGINCQNPFQYIVHLQTFHNNSLLTTH